MSAHREAAEGLINEANTQMSSIDELEDQRANGEDVEHWTPIINRRAAALGGRMGDTLVSSLAFDGEGEGGY